MKAAVREKERGADNPTLEEQVRQRAYELYVMRGDQAGSELDDWLQAEQEILQAQEQGR